MVIPHQTISFSLFLKFRYFDIFGILDLLGGGVFERFRLISIQSINMTNTYWPLVLLSLGGLGFKNGLYIYMMRQFFRGVPDELEESAYIDGCGVLKTFVRVILPLSIPMMITIFLFSFSWQWTDSFYTNLFFTTSSKTVLMPDIIAIPDTIEMNYATQGLHEAAVRNTCGLLIILPLIIIYLFCQRYLIQGIERSGIVG